MARYEELHVARFKQGNPAIDKSALVHGASFTIGAEVSNAITVNIQLTDGMGKDMAQSAAVHAYLASAADGGAIEAAAAGLTVVAGTDGALVETSTDNGFILISEADGDIDVVITDTSGANTVYLVLIMPDGRLVISSAITFAA